MLCRGGGGGGGGVKWGGVGRGRRRLTYYLTSYNCIMFGCGFSLRSACTSRRELTCSHDLNRLFILLTAAIRPSANLQVSTVEKVPSPFCPISFSISVPLARPPDAVPACTAAAALLLDIMSTPNVFVQGQYGLFKGREE